MNVLPVVSNMDETEHGVFWCDPLTWLVSLAIQNTSAKPSHCIASSVKSGLIGNWATIPPPISSTAV